MSNRLINLENISKSYGSQMVLDDMNLYIRENEFLTLLGPSGCGKTTVTCAVLQALAEGEIAPSRHESYLQMYEEAKQIKDWEV